jgi:hypothetical protein
MTSLPVIEKTRYPNEEKDDSLCAERQKERSVYEKIGVFQKLLTLLNSVLLTKLGKQRPCEVSANENLPTKTPHF